jgi:hypothetical protein
VNGLECVWGFLYVQPDHDTPDSKKAVDFVHLIYDGELLGFMGQVATAVLLED